MESINLKNKSINFYFFFSLIRSKIIFIDIRTNAIIKEKNILLNNVQESRKFQLHSSLKGDDTVSILSTQTNKWAEFNQITKNI